MTSSLRNAEGLIIADDDRNLRGLIIRLYQKRKSTTVAGSHASVENVDGLEKVEKRNQRTSAIAAASLIVDFEVRDELERFETVRQCLTEKGSGHVLTFWAVSKEEMFWQTTLK